MGFTKKAVMFEGFMFFIILILLISAFVTLHKKQNKFPEGYWIGERQFNLIKNFQKAEKILFYIDQSAKYSAYQAIYELGQKGGYENLGCGEYFGYSLWTALDTENNILECYPKKEDIEESFKSIFNKNLGKYLMNYQEIYLPVNNYEIQLKNKEIIGLAVLNLEIPVGDMGAEVEHSEILEIMKYEGKKTKLEFEPLTTKPGIKVSDKYRLKGYNRPAGALVDRIILHHTGDDAASKTYDTLIKRKLSVHYIIDRDGTIYYAVDERKMALHTKGWNSRSIGIEIVNTGYKEMEYTEAQYSSIKKLVDDIAKRWSSIKIDNEHVIGHYEASKIGKWDPSPNFDWAKIGLLNHATLIALGKTPPREFGYA